MTMQSLLGVPVEVQFKKQILDQISSYLKSPDEEPLIIVSINPEIMVTAQSNEKLMEVLKNASIRLVDGVGIVLASNVLGIPIGERIAGVDLMKDIVKMSDQKKLKFFILGGYPGTAEELSVELKQKHLASEFKGSHGYLDLQNIHADEERSVVDQISGFNPDIVFVAYGAPFQENWIGDHKDLLQGKVCMTVGGAVDFLSGKVPRAPQLLQKMGLEWLFRLIVQPWRWRRQLKLVTFIKLVLEQKITTHKESGK